MAQHLQMVIMVNLEMVESDGKGSDKKKSGNKDGKKADGSDKAKEGDEQLPVTGESDNNLAAMGVVVMGLMSGLAAMNRRKNQD